MRTTCFLLLAFFLSSVFGACSLWGQSPLVSPVLGANIRLGDDPTQLPPDRRAQAEPFIARSYHDPNFIVAIFQEGRFEDGGAFDCGYAISTDAGLTWTRSLMSNLIATLDGGPFVRATDPVVGIDLQDTVFLNVLALTTVAPTVNGQVVISKSTNGGRSFGPPMVVYKPNNTNSFPDKNWMTVNTFGGTPTVNRVVVTFTLFTDINAVIQSMYSDDQGNTWSPPQPVSSFNCQGSQPIFLPDGSLVVLYYNGSPSQIEISYSADGGGTFSPARLVTPVNVTSDPVARDVGLLPSATTDRQHGVIYVTYKENRDGPRVMFTKSLDRANTWTSPMVVSDNPHGQSVFAPTIAASPDGQHVTIVYYDKRNDTGQGHLVDFYLAESFDGGGTWGPNIRLTEVSSDLTLTPLTSLGRMLGDYFGIVPALGYDFPGVAIWIDTRTGSPDPFCARLQRTQGTTFATWQKLEFGPAQLADPSLSGAAADPHQNGIPNLMRYAFGLGMAASTNAGSFPGSMTSQNSTVTFSYERSPVLSDIAFVWWSSTNLVDWVSVTPSAERTNTTLNGLIQGAEAIFPAQPAPANFYRAGVKLNTN